MAYDEKWPGLCTKCGQQTHKVIEQFPVGHPFEKKPRRLGERLNARRLHMLLTDGTQVPLTFCSDCHPEPDEYPKLWHLLIESWRREQTDVHRKIMNPTVYKPYNDNQKKALEKFNDRMRGQAVLGIFDAD